MDIVRTGSGRERSSPKGFISRCYGFSVSGFCDSFRYDCYVSYQVLARRYRPRTFAQVVGQNHIVEGLSRAIEKTRVGQSYLFVGPRGVGKTSTARILAKSLNCHEGESVAPCLSCPSCAEIEKGNCLDVIEIDGASNNLVDDVRTLRERVHFQPMRDRRKIYIIDEVQRLTGSAFDALLRTLEEPPGYAHFIFATTDPQKIPDTIVSRCQVFEFRRLGEVAIREKLTEICGSEGIAVDDAVLSAISRGCRGGMRDAEGMLDQLLAASREAPTLDDLERVVGLARPDHWRELLEAIEKDDAPSILLNVDSFLARGGGERDFVEQACDAVRDLLHIVLLGHDSLGVTPAPETREHVIDLAGRFGRDRLEALLGLLLGLESRMAKAPLASRALLEWTLLRAARLGEFVETGALLEALGRDSRVTGASPTTSNIPVRASSEAVEDDSSEEAEALKAEENSPRASEEVVDANEALPTFDDLLAAVGKRRPTLGKVLGAALISGTVHGGGVDVILRPIKGDDRDLLDDPVEKAFLSSLPGSPGPWTLEFQTPAKSFEDTVGRGLEDAFGAREEVP